MIFVRKLIKFLKERIVQIYSFLAFKEQKSRFLMLNLFFLHVRKKITFEGF